MSSTVPAGGPVTSEERIAFLDILRGFAVMAIFIVNIKAMAMPLGWYINPVLWASDLDQHIATLQKFLVDDKWRTTFTALYGAGLLMISRRVSARGEKGILLRRNLWLIAFGAVHLFLIWVGDILLTYGLTGLLAMGFVRIEKTWKFLAAGLVLLVLGIAWSGFFSAAPAYDPELLVKLKPMFWQPAGEELEIELMAMRGGILEQASYRAAGAVGFIGMYFILGGMWLVTLGLMVTGMGLYQAGLYRGAWPARLTLPLGLFALGAAWALDWMQIVQLEASGYDFRVFSVNGWLASVDGVLGALGYACLISALVSFGLRFGAVAAVGRMAFTNYIACSLIGTTLAGGHAFGLFGSVTLWQLMLVVVATFVGMLIWSPLWLRAYRFGPLEWLWRSLVYRQRQPFRRPGASASSRPRAAA